MKRYALLANLFIAHAALATPSFNPPKETLEPAPVAAEEAAPEPAPIVEDKAAAAAQAQVRQQAAFAEADYRRKLDTARSEASVEVNGCKEKYIAGKLKTHVQMVNCFNNKVTSFFLAAGYPYADLLKALQEKRLVVARLIDKKIYTEAQGEAELAAYEKAMGAKEVKRNAAKAAAPARKTRGEAAAPN